MAMTLGGPRQTASEINVTPLIDVLLVLLIIFMVILPQHYSGEKTELPQKNIDRKIQDPERAIVIQLREAGASQRPTLAINYQDVTWDNLEARLKDIYLRRTDKVAFLKGDPAIDFQYVAELVDMTHHAGITRVGLLGANQ
jgi:biopolymer transport protein TolR